MAMRSGLVESHEEPDLGDNALVKRILKEAGQIRDMVLKGEKPSMRFPLCNVSNVRYEVKAGKFNIGRKSKERTLSVATVKTFAQSLKMLALAKRLIETDDIAPKREVYSVAKGWAEEVRFGEQAPSAGSGSRCWRSMRPIASVSGGTTSGPII